MKQCYTCKKEKPLTEFTKKKKSKDGLYHKCKPCKIEYDKKWYVEHPDAREEHNLKYNLGISLKEKRNIINFQNEKCPICMSYLEKGKKTHVDHCHKSGKIRGVLCSYCNLLLGNAKDNIETLKKAIQYLLTHQP
jgi:hypothetical protein